MVILGIVYGVASGNAVYKEQQKCISEGGKYYDGLSSCYPTQCRIEGYMFCKCKGGCLK